MPGGKGGREMVPTFTTRSISQLGAQLYPGSIATPTPQAFSVASPPPELNGFGVRPGHRPEPVHCIPSHIRQV